jgi:hypothetical protein
MVNVDGEGEGDGGGRKDNRYSNRPSEEKSFARGYSVF